MNVDHIGVAVRSLDAAVKAYAALGLHPEVTEDLPTEGVRVALLRAGRPRPARFAQAATDSLGRQDAHIELLEPLTADGPVAKFLEKRGEGIHHIALAVDDIEAEMARARSAGLAVIDEAPRVGARGRKVAFVHPKTTGGVLLEFVQYAPP